MLFYTNIVMRANFIKFVVKFLFYSCSESAMDELDSNVLKFVSVFCQKLMKFYLICPFHPSEWLEVS